MDSPTDKAATSTHEEILQHGLSAEPYGPSGLKGIWASRYVSICASLSALGGLLFGYDQGVVSIILVMPEFIDRFPQISDSAPGGGFYKGLMTAMITLGAVVGAANQGWIADAYSRKYSIMMAVVVFTVGSALQTAAMDYTMLVIARFIGGVGIGMLSMVAPLYIAEISPPEIRGSLLVLHEFSIVVGIVVAFWTTYGTQYMTGSEWAWRLPFLLQIAPALLLGAGAVFLPFSPRWLASKGRYEEALQSLTRLRELPELDGRVQREWLDIIAESKFQHMVLSRRHADLINGTTRTSKIKLELATWADCFRNGCWRRTLVGAGLMFFQQFVGINALIYYSPTLFSTMGLNFDMQLKMSGVLNIVQLVGILTSFWTLDRYGRRKVLMAGSIAMAVPHIIISVLVGLYSSDWPSRRPEGWTAVAMLFTYMFAFGSSWGPVPWAMPAEIFPSSLRAKGVAISTCSNWINNFIIGLITPPLIQATDFGTYAFFGAFCLASFAATYFFVPETNAATLEDMDKVFKDNLGQADIELKARLFHETVREQGPRI